MPPLPIYDVSIIVISTQTIIEALLLPVEAAGTAYRICNDRRGIVPYRLILSRSSTSK